MCFPRVQEIEKLSSFNKSEKFALQTFLCNITPDSLFVKAGFLIVDATGLAGVIRAYLIHLGWEISKVNQPASQTYQNTSYKKLQDICYRNITLRRPKKPAMATEVLSCVYLVNIKKWNFEINIS